MPGPNRRITWKAGTEIKNADNISFRFKGEIVHKLSFTSPSVDGKVKRGKKATLQWQGGKSDEQVTITLLSPNEESSEIIKTKNTGSFIWLVPKNIKTGSGYALRITGSENFSEQRFTIKRKSPLIWFAIPVVGAAIFIITNSGGKGESDLPDAPEPN